MKNILEYKGYHTKIEFDTDNYVAYGKIEGIDDLVTFEADELKNIKQEFQNAVDEYLQFCEEVGKTPEKEYKGTFNVRISPKLHRDVAMLANKNGESLNQTVEKAIQLYVKGTSQTETNIQAIYNLLLSDIYQNRNDYNNIRTDIEYVSDLAFGKYGIDNIKMRYRQ